MQKQWLTTLARRLTYGWAVFCFLSPLLGIAFLQQEGRIFGVARTTTDRNLLLRNTVDSRHCGMGPALQMSEKQIELPLIHNAFQMDIGWVKAKLALNFCMAGKGGLNALFYGALSVPTYLHSWSIGNLLEMSAGNFGMGICGGLCGALVTTEAAICHATVVTGREPYGFLPATCHGRSAFLFFRSICTGAASALARRCCAWVDNHPVGTSRNTFTTSFNGRGRRHRSSQKLGDRFSPSG